VIGRRADCHDCLGFSQALPIQAAACLRRLAEIYQQARPVSARAAQNGPQAL